MIGDVRGRWLVEVTWEAVERRSEIEYGLEADLERGWHWQRYSGCLASAGSL